MFDNKLYLEELYGVDEAMEAIDRYYLSHEGRSKRDGAPVGSGRYPLGSGEHPFQNKSWYAWTQLRESLKQQGLSDKEIYEYMNMTSSEYRRMISITNAEKKADIVNYVTRLRDERGMSVNAIAKQLGVNESTIRSYLDPVHQAKSQEIQRTADTLMECLKENPYIDVGSGTSTFMGVSDEKLKAAIQKLESEGYKTVEVYVDQIGVPGQKTTIKVLCPEDTVKSDIYNHLDQITPVSAHFEEINGETKAFHWEYPQSISSDRVLVRYAEDGGLSKDGTIELRRGVEDLNLGDNVHYAQVRIGVDDTHYLKGMALYSDSIPDGYDVVFNTNKTRDVDKMDVFKKMKTDDNGEINRENPFGSSLRMEDAQHHYTDADGNTQLGAINKVRQEGDWDKWSKSLPAQMLSKQSTEIAKQQLAIKYDNLKDEYDQIMQMTNPVVKKHLLSEFAEKCDSAASDLKAAAMPRQTSKVILPVDALKDNEIYAPGYNNGESVVLIRFPHGGTFEIPTLTVNNRNKAAKDLLGQAIDAVGINSSVAGRLSGADFDGDTVLVIPTDGKKIKTSAPLKGLKDFEPKRDYKAYEGMPKVGKEDKFDTQMQMGKITNLIADMQLKGAPLDDVCLAVRHSMVVIDAEKHNLNWKQSEADHDIKRLKAEWQGGATKGASTLITRAKSQDRVQQRKPWQATNNSIDPETGEKIYQNTKDSIYTTKDGKVKTKNTKTTKMATAKSASELYSEDGPLMMEVVYGNHADKCKALGNQARKSWLETGSQEYSPSARKTYSAEVESMNKKLATAETNSPKERQAQAVANARWKAKVAENPSLKTDKDAQKKEKNRLLTEARTATGAHKERIVLTDREWEAIQAGAVTNNTLTRIFNNSDKERVKELAMPKYTYGLTTAQLNRARNLLASGYTQAEVADYMGISTSTLSKNLNQ